MMAEKFVAIYENELWSWMLKGEGRKRATFGSHYIVLLSWKKGAFLQWVAKNCRRHCPQSDRRSLSLSNTGFLTVSYQNLLKNLSRLQFQAPPLNHKSLHRLSKQKFLFKDKKLNHHSLSSKFQEAIEGKFPRTAVEPLTTLYFS